MNQTIPKITVLMSVFNGAAFLRESIQSILDQTYSDFEFLIIDDGSRDHSLEIIQSLKDPRIKLLPNEKNMGLIYSLNRGLTEAKGLYIARHDGDDISLPTRLEKEFQFLETHPKVGVVGSYFIAINEAGDFLQNFRPPINNESIQQKLLIKNCFAHGTVMFRKNCIEKVGGYRPELKHCEDYDLWLRISEHYELANIPEYLYTWRLNIGAVSVENKLLQNQNVLKAQQMHQTRVKTGNTPIKNDNAVNQATQISHTQKNQLQKIKIEALQYQGSSYLLNNQINRAFEFYKQALAEDSFNIKTLFLIFVAWIKELIPNRLFLLILKGFSIISPKVNY